MTIYNSLLNISNSSFYSNIVSQGGTIYSMNSNIFIHSSKFYNNSADFMEGSDIQSESENFFNFLNISYTNFSTMSRTSVLI